MPAPSTPSAAAPARPRPSSPPTGAFAGAVREAGYAGPDDTLRAAIEAVGSGRADLAGLGLVVVHLPRRLGGLDLGLVAALVTAGVEVTAVIGRTGDAASDTAAEALLAQLRPVLGTDEAADALVASVPAPTELVRAPDPAEEVAVAVRRIVAAVTGAAASAGPARARRRRLPRARPVRRDAPRAPRRRRHRAHHAPAVTTVAQSVPGRVLLGLLDVAAGGLRRADVAALLRAGPARRPRRRAPGAGAVLGPPGPRGRRRRRPRRSGARGSAGPPRSGASASLAWTARDPLVDVDPDVDVGERLAADRPPGGARRPRALRRRARRPARASRRSAVGGVGGVGRRVCSTRTSHRRRRAGPTRRRGVGARRWPGSPPSTASTQPPDPRARSAGCSSPSSSGPTARHGRFGHGVLVGRLVDVCRRRPRPRRRGRRLPTARCRRAGRDDPLVARPRAARRRRRARAAGAAAGGGAPRPPRRPGRGAVGRAHSPRGPTRASSASASRRRGSSTSSAPGRPARRQRRAAAWPGCRGGAAGSPTSPRSRPASSPPPAAPAGDDELDLGDLLADHRSGHRVADGVVAGEHAGLARGLAAARCPAGRRASTSGPGRVGDHPGLLDRLDRPRSPTGLERYAECPFRSFLGDVLRVGAIDDPTEAELISPMDEGSLVHEVLERFIGEHARQAARRAVVRRRARRPLDASPTRSPAATRPRGGPAGRCCGACGGRSSATSCSGSSTATSASGPSPSVSPGRGRARLRRLGAGDGRRRPAPCSPVVAGVVSSPTAAVSPSAGSSTGSTARPTAAAWSCPTTRPGKPDVFRSNATRSERRPHRAGHEAAAAHLRPRRPAAFPDAEQVDAHYWFVGARGEGGDHRRRVRRRRRDAVPRGRSTTSSTASRPGGSRPTPAARATSSAQWTPRQLRLVRVRPRVPDHPGRGVGAAARGARAGAATSRSPRSSPGGRRRMTARSRPTSDRTAPRSTATPATRSSTTSTATSSSRPAPAPARRPRSSTRIVRLFATGPPRRDPRSSPPSPSPRRPPPSCATASAPPSSGPPTRPRLDRRRRAGARAGPPPRRIDEAVITTLHGFAQRILAEHPVAAGLPPAFEVDEGIPAELEFVERWAAFVDELLADPDLTDDLRVGVTLGLLLPRLAEVARRAPRPVGPARRRSSSPIAGPVAAARRRRRSDRRRPAAAVARARPARRRAPTTSWCSSSLGDGRRRARALRRRRRHRRRPLEVLRVLDRVAPSRSRRQRAQGDLGRASKAEVQRRCSSGAASAQRRAARRSSGRHVLARLVPRIARLHPRLGRRAAARRAAALPRPARARPRPAVARRRRSVRRWPAVVGAPRRRVPGHRPAPGRAGLRPRRRRPRPPAGAVGGHRARRRGGCSSSATPSSRSTASAAPTSRSGTAPRDLFGDGVVHLRQNFRSVDVDPRLGQRRVRARSSARATATSSRRTPPLRARPRQPRRRARGA